MEDSIFRCGLDFLRGCSFLSEEDQVSHKSKQEGKKRGKDAFGKTQNHTVAFKRGSHLISLLLDGYIHNHSYTLIHSVLTKKRVDVHASLCLSRR